MHARYQPVKRYARHPTNTFGRTSRVEIFDREMDAGGSHESRQVEVEVALQQLCMTTSVQLLRPFNGS